MEQLLHELLQEQSNELKNEIEQQKRITQEQKNQLSKYVIAHDSLIDFSLERKIILCSPITLYAILSLVRQAVSNFAMEQKAGQMQVLVGVFRKQWEQYKSKINAMSNSLSALTNHYEELRGPRLRGLEKPMDKISELQLGNNDRLLNQKDT